MLKINFYLLVLSFLQINKINCGDKLAELEVCKISAKSSEAEPLTNQLALATVSALQTEAFDLMLAAEELGAISQSEPEKKLLTNEQELALASFVHSPIIVPTKPTHKHKVPTGLQEFVDSSGSSGDYANMLEKAVKQAVKK